MLNNGPQTKAVHASKHINRTNAVSPPIWQTSTFTAETPELFAEAASSVRPVEFYTRYGNPNHAMVEATIAKLESGEAGICSGSGMGAIFTTLFALLKPGDHIIVQKNHYVGSASIFRHTLPTWGVEISFVDQRINEEFEAAIRPNTKLIYVETPVNPFMEITDLRFVSELAKRHELITVCDNTFATPINQRPIEFGIDIIVHSATKYLGGHSDVSAGAIIGTKSLMDKIWATAVITGATLGPFDSWLLLRGIRTLGLRVEHQNKNGLALAQLLEKHPKIKHVNYPGLESHPQHELAKQQMSGFSGMLSFEIEGGYSAAERLVSNLELATRAGSLGGVETLAVHVASMWPKNHAAEKGNDFDESLVRVSAGVEDTADLLHDFERALTH